MNEENATETKQVTAIPVEFEKDGLVVFNDSSQLARAAQLLIQLKIPPESLIKGGPQAVAAALTFCQQRQLPYSAMGSLAWIRGKLGVFASLRTALAQRDPEYGEMVVLYTDEKMNVISLENKNLNAPVWACVIQYKKKGDDKWHEYYFTLEEAKLAGLTSSDTYKKYLKDMLYHKANTRCMNTEHPKYLNGVESAELLQIEEKLKDVSPVDELNKKFGLTQIELKNEE